MSDILALGFVHPHEVSASFMDSVVSVLLDDAQRPERRIIGKGAYITVGSGPRIASARNDVVRRVLASKADWLLMVDADMVFDASHVDKILEVAHWKERPIVGGLCIGGGRAGKFFPTLYRLRQPTEENPAPVEVIEDYPEDAMCEVDATGAAFLLIHRSVLHKMGQTFPEPAPWFVEGAVYNGLAFGEDWAFCMRAQQLGYPIHVHTGIQIGHEKPVVVTPDNYLSHRKTQLEVV